MRGQFRGIRESERPLAGQHEADPGAAEEIDDGADHGRSPPPPSAGEGGPRFSEGRKRGTPLPKVARPSWRPMPPSASSLPAPPVLRRVPSPAEGGGTSRIWAKIRRPSSPNGSPRSRPRAAGR
ncbi:hypothetical protein FVE89_19345 [Methylobacterium sp. 2A]|nr:hypothetical protein [Methylobacterium sp. 2A]